MTTSPCDLIVIGGGITGLGAALAGTERGLRVTLLEKQPALGTAASAGSLRIIHGGLRYLQTLDVPRVITSILARDELIRRHPAHVQPLRCLLPAEHPCSLKGVPALWAASLAYSTLEFLLLRRWTGAGITRWRNRPHFYWHDGIVTNHTAFTATLAAEITARGGEIRTGHAVTTVTADGDGYTVQTADGARLSGRAVIHAARAAHDAADIVFTPADRFHPALPPYVWTKAFNLVLAQPAPVAGGLAVTGPGRQFFIVPRGPSSALGTYYLPFKPGDPVAVTPAEIAAFLADYNACRAVAPLTPADVTGCDIGILPVRRLHGQDVSFFGSSLLARNGRYVEILATKYTTFLRSGRAAVRQLGL